MLRLQRICPSQIKPRSTGDRDISTAVKTGFRSWHIRSSWILPTCPVVHWKDNRKWAAMLGAKWQTTGSVYYVSGGFPLWNDLHRWSRLIISQSVVFPSYRKNTFTPDFLLHPDKYTRQFGRDRQGKHSVNTEDAVSPSADWGPGGRSVGNLQFTVQKEIRKYSIHTDSTLWKTPPV